MAFKFVSAVLLAVVLTACSPAGGSSPPVEASPIPGEPLLSTLPASPPEEPPANAPTRSIGTPVPGWEDIPIMPGAYDAELEDIVYLYSVDATADQVEEFYLAKMDVNGWTLLNRQVIEAGPSSGPSTVLDFQRQERLLNVILVNLADQNATSVILSVLGP